MIGTEDNSRELRRSQIIYKGQCIDSNDPLRLGRIRAILKTENQRDREIQMRILENRHIKNGTTVTHFYSNHYYPFLLIHHRKKMSLYIYFTTI